MKDCKGFSVLELLVCLTLLSIVSIISYPPIRQMLARIELQQEVSSFVFQLHRAKVEAIKSNTLVVVQATAQGYMIFVDNGAGLAIRGDWLLQPDERLLVRHTFRAGMSMTSNFRGNRLRFRPWPGISAGSFEIVDGGGQRMQIILNILGRIRVIKI